MLVFENLKYLILFIKNTKGFYVGGSVINSIKFNLIWVIQKAFVFLF